MLTIIHGADFHLGRPVCRPAPGQGQGPPGRAAGAATGLAGLAEERRADVVLLSGDLLDGGQTYQETVQALARTLGGIPAPVFIAPGNHDCYGPRSVYAGTARPDNVQIFSTVAGGGGGAARPQLRGARRGLYHPPGRPLSPDGLCRPTGRAHHRWPSMGTWRGRDATAPSPWRTSPPAA